MFLEQNNISAVIVRRLPSNDTEVAVWRRIAAKRHVLFLVDHDDDRYGAIAGFAGVRRWDDTDYPPVSGNIKAALNELDAQPYEAIYVTDDSADLTDAIGTRVGVIRIGAKLSDHVPDLYVEDTAGVEKVLDDADRGVAHGYLAEVRATRGRFGNVQGSVGWLIFEEGALGHRPHLDKEAVKRVRLVVLGRYFPRTDQRHKKHQLSQRILAAKDGNPRGKILSDPLGCAIGIIHSKGFFDVITRVPPRPGKSDHLVPLVTDALARLAHDGGPTLADVFKPSAIKCVRQYRPQKGVGDFRTRSLNIAGAFRADPPIVSSKSVLLIDDILTSGATAIEAARALFDAGATGVTVVVIGADQRVIVADSSKDLPCPKPGCDGAMVIRYNPKDDGAFWGCTRFVEGTCSTTYTWKRGLVLYNRLNDRDDIETSRDVEF